MTYMYVIYRRASAVCTRAGGRLVSGSGSGKVDWDRAGAVREKH